MIAAWFRRWAEARAFKHADPLPEDVLRLLREVPAEAKSIRRHRRMRRRHLKAQGWPS